MENVWMALIAMIGVQVGNWISGYYRDREAARRVEQVRLTLAARAEVEDGRAKATTKKLDDNSAKLDVIHTLTNGGMGLQIQLKAVALRRLADLARRFDLDTYAGDAAAAEAAEQEYREHLPPDSPATPTPPGSAP